MSRKKEPEPINEAITRFLEDLDPNDDLIEKELEVQYRKFHPDENWNYITLQLSEFLRDRLQIPHSTALFLTVRFIKKKGKPLWK